VVEVIGCALGLDPSGVLGSAAFMTITLRTDAQAGLGTRARLTAMTIAVVWPTLLIAAYCEPSWNAFALVGGTLFLAVGAAIVISSAALRSLRQTTNDLCAAADRVRQNQDFSARAISSDDDELGRLTSAFNSMLARLEIRDRELDKHHRQIETTLVERTRERDRQMQDLRGVLDSIEQGVVLLDRAGMPSAERNAVFDRWFGAPEPGQAFAQIVARLATPFDAAFRRQWQQLLDGILPVELNVEQLPRGLSTENGRHYQLSYRTLGEDPERFDRLLVIVSDITEKVTLAAREADHTHLLELVEQLWLDPRGFAEFFKETEQLIESLASYQLHDATTTMRELHTLKANFGLFGLQPLAALVHEMEESCFQRGQSLSDHDRLELTEAWQRFANRARPFIVQRAPTVSVDRHLLELLLTSLREHRPAVEIAELAGKLMQEPVAPKLARMGERARALALRLGKGPVRVEVDAEGVHAATHLGWLWRVLPLVVANSVDHGLDEHSERIAQGKPAEGKLRIAAIAQPASLIIEVEDDGRGVDWTRVRTEAQRLGLPTRTHEDLVSALFADRLSTGPRSEVSGRGVGLAAVEAACQQHGARIGVVSEPGKGTLFRFVVDNVDDESAPRESYRFRSGAA
jgi:two-component system chemotaxis sensor kinase CheA